MRRSFGIGIALGCVLALVAPSVAAGAATTIEDFATPAASYGITAGPDGALWFTEAAPDDNRIGRMTTDGVVPVEYTVPTARSVAENIVTGPDRALWFSESIGNTIGRLTTTGSFTEFTLPTAGSQPKGIAVGPDDALWFTEAEADRIGRITTEGEIDEFPLPLAGAFP